MNHSSPCTGVIRNLHNLHWALVLHGAVDQDSEVSRCLVGGSAFLPAVPAYTFGSPRSLYQVSSSEYLWAPISAVASTWCSRGTPRYTPHKVPGHCTLRGGWSMRHTLVARSFVRGINGADSRVDINGDRSSSQADQARRMTSAWGSHIRSLLKLRP